MKLMDSDSENASTEAQIDRPGLLSSIFVNQRTEQLRGGWKALLFLSIWIALYAPGWFSKPDNQGPQLSQTDTYWWDLVPLLIFVPVMLGQTAICTRLLEHRSIKGVGVGFHSGWLRDLAAGWLISTLMIALVAAFHVFRHVGEFQSSGLSADAVLTAILKGAILYLIAAFFEELMMRGFPLQALIRDNSVVVAVLVMSVIFAVFHIANSGFSWLAFFNTVLAGVWLSIAYLKTRSLWLATGLHTGWNYAMGVIFGYAVSGNSQPTASLLKAHMWGSHWITGGDYGPEGGFVVTVVVVLVSIWLWRSKWFKPSDEMLQLTADVFHK